MVTGPRTAPPTAPGTRGPRFVFFVLRVSSLRFVPCGPNGPHGPASCSSCPRSSLRFVPSWSKRHMPHATCPWSKRPPRLPTRRGPNGTRGPRFASFVLRVLRYVSCLRGPNAAHGTRHPAPPWPKHRPRRPPQGAGTAVPAPQGHPSPASSRWYAFQPGHQPVSSAIGEPTASWAAVGPLPDRTVRTPRPCHLVLLATGEKALPERPGPPSG